MSKSPNVIKSFTHAFNGIVAVVRSERNARVHLLVAIIVLLLGTLLQISDAELAAIFFAIVLVFVTEIVNTAIEKTLDLVHPKDNSQVKLVKDIAAGAVMVATIGAVGIGVAVFIPYIEEVLWH
jgi:diacylglycerol kinase